MGSAVEQEIRVKIKTLVDGLNNVKELTSAVHLLQSQGMKKLGIDADTSGGAKLVKLLRDISPGFDSAISRAERLTGTLGGSGLLGVLGPVAGGLGAAGAAGVGLGATLFGMAKAAADSGSKINDLSEKTGLSAETLSSLDFAAQQSGSSLEQIDTEIVHFVKTVGEFNNGNAEAREKLIRLGFDPQKPITDLNAALARAFKTVHDAPPGIEQMNRATDAFGKTGANVIPVINSFHGDLGELLATAKRLGVQLSQEDVKAAEEFGDALNLLEVQTRALSNKLALQYAPEISGAMHEISESAAENKDLITLAGAAIAEQFREITGAIKFARVEWEKFKLLFPNDAAALTAFTGVGAPPSTPAPTTAPAQQGHDLFGGTGRFLTPEELQAQAAKQQRQVEAALSASRSAANTVAEAAYQRAVAEADALYKRTGDYIAFVARLKAAERERWEARRQQFEAEQKAISERITEDDGAVRVKAAELEASRAQEAQARVAFQNRMAELDRDAADKSLATLKLSSQRAQEIRDLEFQAYVEHQNQLAEQGRISFVEAQRRIDAETANEFNRRREALEAEKEAAGGDAEAYGEISHELEVLSTQAQIFARTMDGRIAAALSKDADRFIQQLERIMGLFGDIKELTSPVNVPGVGGSGVSAGEFPGLRPDQQPQEAPPSIEPLRRLAQIQQTARDINSRLRQDISDTFTDILTRTRSVKEAFGDLGRDILNMIARILAERFIERFLGGVLGGDDGTGGAGGLFSRILLGGGKVGTQQQQKQGGGPSLDTLSGVIKNFHTQTVGGIHEVNHSTLSVGDDVFAGTNKIGSQVGEIISFLPNLLPAQPSLWRSLLMAGIQFAGALAGAAVSGGGGKGGADFSPGGKGGPPSDFFMSGFHSRGGPITGPGTDTSDSIPAMLSNGEFVINAKAVRSVGVDVLAWINNVGRLPELHLAAGGLVDVGALSVVADKVKVPEGAALRGGGEGGARVTVNMNVHTPDAGKFRQSKDQLVRELARELQAAMNRSVAGRK